MVAWHAAGDRAGNLFTAFVRAGSEAGCQEQQFAAEVRDQPLGDVVAKDVDQPVLVGQGGGT
jgi:hypothetical protein